MLGALTCTNVPFLTQRILQVSTAICICVTGYFAGFNHLARTSICGWGPFPKISAVYIIDYYGNDSDFEFLKNRLMSGESWNKEKLQGVTEWRRVAAYVLDNHLGSQETSRILSYALLHHRDEDIADVGSKYFIKAREYSVAPTLLRIYLDNRPRTPAFQFAVLDADDVLHELNIGELITGYLVDITVLHYDSQGIDLFRDKKRLLEVMERSTDVMLDDQVIARFKKKTGITLEPTVAGATRQLLNGELKGPLVPSDTQREIEVVIRDYFGRLGT